MDKQLIERIALEVAKDLVFPGFEIDAVMSSALTKYAGAFLARIDAERGKDAVAWSFELASLYDQQSGEYSGWSQHLSRFKPNAGKGMRNLVALSPTIPEGVALVPVDPTTAMVVAGVKRMLNKDDPTTEPYNIYKAMLAAAQGERNAD